MAAKAPSPTIIATRMYRVDIVTANADVADGPELRDINDRPFRVDHIVACWKRHESSGAWWLEWVKVSGPRVLKSGTASGARLDLHLDTAFPGRRPDWANAWLIAKEPAKEPRRSAEEAGL